MRQSGRRGWAAGWLVPADALCVVAAYVLAFALRFHGVAVYPGHHASNMRALLKALPLFVAISLGLAQAYGLYQRYPLTWPEQVQSMFLLVVLDGVLAMAASFFARTFAVPRSVLAIAGVLDFLLLYGYRRLAYTRWMARAGPPRLLLVHAGAGAPPTLPEGPGALFALAGAFAWDAAAPTTWGPQLEQDLTTQRAHGLLLDHTLPDTAKEELALWALERRLELFLVPRLLDLLVLQSHPAPFGDRLVVNLSASASAGYQRALKRFVDISLSVLFLLLTWPVLVVAALLIALDDGRPILYRQERLGIHGRRFQVLKLRTMRRDAEAATGPVLASRDDPRATRVGRWLRHLHVDEIPQLWNVLCGEMSLVGPRPERPAIHADVAAALPAFGARLRVLPGLTGLAQVHGGYDTQPHEKLKYDVLYAARASAAMDVQILLRTARSVLGGLRRAAAGRRP